MGTSIERGSGSVPGVGRASWQLQVTKTSSGAVHMRMLQSARLLDEGHPIGREDSRFQRIADFLGAV